MEQYIRTNEDGEREVNYDLLDMAARANMLEMADRWAESIELDLDDPDFSEAEKASACNDAAATEVFAAEVFDADGNEIEIEPDTEQMLIDRIENRLRERYGI